MGIKILRTVCVGPCVNGSVNFMSCKDGTVFQGCTGDTNQGSGPESDTKIEKVSQYI